MHYGAAAMAAHTFADAIRMESDAIIPVQLGPCTAVKLVVLWTVRNA